MKPNRKPRAILATIAMVALTLTATVSPASAESYRDFNDNDFYRWRTTEAEFRQLQTGTMHVHVLTDGNHKGFTYFVDDLSEGIEAASSGAWCAPGETICATAFSNVQGPFNYKVGMINSAAGYNKIKVNVTEIRVGTTD